MQNILDAIQSGTATSGDFANLELPDHYRAAYVKTDEVDMFEGVASRDQDPRKSLHIPTLSKTYGLDEVGQAALDVHKNAHQGKVGVLCLAPEEGLGVRNPELRAKHLDAINRFRGV